MSLSELIAILTNRDNYYRFKPFIKDHAVPKETRLIIHDLDEYYTLNPSIDNVDIDKFRTWFLVLKHSRLKPEQADIYHEIFDNVNSILKSSTVLNDSDIVESFIERDFATRIADLSLKVAEGDNALSLMECESLLDEYRSEAKRCVGHDESLVDNDLTELFDDTLSPGLNWSLNCLNKSLGPVRQGDLVVVGKLPEAGGTAFAISQACHMLQQMESDQHVLYFGNEEKGNALHKRVVYSLTNKNKDEVKRDIVKVADDYKTVHRGDDFKIFSAQGMTLHAIERIIKHYNPGLIVFDQLHKVNISDKEGTVQKIKKLFEEARIIASDYAPVIAVHQCDGTAYNSVYAGMEQLYMSRIGIQGEADAIITIGVSTEPGNEKTRYINIPKNKLDGGHMSEEQYRHSKWEVTIDAERTRYYD